MTREQRTPRYFVLHLEPGEERPEPDLAYEIQILDAAGRARACGHVGEGDEPLFVDGEEVPLAVIRAARRQALGQGDYVDSRGVAVPAF